DAKFCRPFAGKCLAIVGIRTETADQLDRTYRARTHGLRAGLPPRTKNSHHARIFAREIFDAEPIGGANPHALHDAVRKYRQRFAAGARKQQNQAALADAWWRARVPA